MIFNVLKYFYIMFSNIFNIHPLFYKMAWNPRIQGQWNAKYLYFKNNHRVGKKTKTKYIYFGPIDVAVEILGDLQTKPLINERLVTYSGETILGKIAYSIGLTQVLEKYTDGKKAHIMRNIIVLRALFNESKRGLVERILPDSVLRDKVDIGYVGKVYRSMDSIYNNLDEIIYELAKNAVKKYKLNLSYLAIDGTGIKIYKDKETGLVKFGYPPNGLPQVKLVLGVNKQHIPLLGKCYPGNTADVEVFDDIVDGLDSKYNELSKKSRKNYVVFDQGNLNEKNVEHMREYEDKRIFFVSLARLATARRFIDNVDKSKLKLIYENEISENNCTKIYGKSMKGEIYGKKCSVLVCYNPDIAKKKNKTLDRRVENVRKKVIEINKSKKPDVSEAMALISKYNLKNALEVNGKKTFNLVVNDTEIENRRKYFGFFVPFSNDMHLNERMIDIYKFRDVIEEGFRVLKTDMEIAPGYHGKDDRIQTHNVLVVCGYLLLSILRVILAAHGKKYSFAALKRLIVSGYLNEGYYEHKQFKNKRLWLMEPIGFREELKVVFSALRIRMPKFDMALHPQISREMNDD